MLLQSQPISGVSTQREAALETVYPSVGAGGTAQWFGRLFESIDTKVCGVKLSYALFCLPALPIMLVLYFVSKLFGQRFTLTNRSVQLWRSLGNHQLKSVLLAEITDVVVVVRPGQEFFNCGDIELRGTRGDVRMELCGVPRPERFRQIVIDARQARTESDAALSQIASRG